jgi:hypothetical protein
MKQSFPTKVLTQEPAGEYADKSVETLYNYFSDIETLFPNFVKKDFKQLVYFTNENKIFPKTKR